MIISASKKALCNMYNYIIGHIMRMSESDYQKANRTKKRDQLENLELDGSAEERFRMERDLMGGKNDRGECEKIETDGDYIIRFTSLCKNLPLLEFAKN